MQSDKDTAALKGQSSHKMKTTAKSINAKTNYKTQSQKEKTQPRQEKHINK